MDPTPSPFADLDYPQDAGGDLARPSAALGPLAKDLRDLYCLPGPICLAAAILLDQGRASEALELLEREADRLDAEADAARTKQSARRARGGS